VCTFGGRLVFNVGGEVVPVMGMSKVWRTFRLVMLSMVPWLTTIWYVMATQMIATKRTGWPVVYRPIPQPPVVRGIVDAMTVAGSSMIVLRWNMLTRQWRS
jgi:hypothetical protein